jgi:hypothetical protein
VCWNKTGVAQDYSKHRKLAVQLGDSSMLAKHSCYKPVWVTAAKALHFFNFNKIKNAPDSKAVTQCKR